MLRLCVISKFNEFSVCICVCVCVCVTRHVLFNFWVCCGLIIWVLPRFLHIFGINERMIFVSETKQNESKIMDKNNNELNQCYTNQMSQNVCYFAVSVVKAKEQLIRISYGNVCEWLKIELDRAHFPKCIFQMGEL